MNWHDKTIKVYDDSSEALAEYFQDSGARIADIERALKFAGNNPKSRVIEIGCGDGRDAKEIIKRVDWYEGFDPSIGMLKVARRRLPNQSFVLADSLTYKYPEKLDVIFAFASLLHVEKHDLVTVFENASKALRPGGIFYISLKEKDKYTAETKIDDHGERMFYFYNPDIIKELAGVKFVSVFEDHQKRKIDWFTIALKRK